MYLETVASETSIPSFCNSREFAGHPRADWPGTYAESGAGSPDQSLVVRGDDSSSASSIGNLADASVQLFLVARYEGTLANPPKSVTLRPRITDLRPSVSVEDDDI